MLARYVHYNGSYLLPFLWELFYRFFFFVRIGSYSLFLLGFILLIVAKAGDKQH